LAVRVTSDFLLVYKQAGSGFRLKEAWHIGNNVTTGSGDPVLVWAASSHLSLSIHSKTFFIFVLA
jgi:hypothetical protein